MFTRESPGRYNKTTARPVMLLMCGRFSVTRELDQLAAFFGFSVPDTPFRPRYNVAPLQFAPVVLLDDAGRRQMRMLRWGLLPAWAKDEKLAGKLINARGETLGEKPSYRSAFKHRRCLVLADGFYEWQKLPRGAKQPYRLLLKDAAPFAMAGLWEKWITPEGDPLETFTIVTTEPNEFTRAVHDRMPVILSEADAARWLDPAATPEELSALLRPYPAELMDGYPVSDIVNSPHHDDPQCALPLHPEEGPATPA